MLRQPLFCYAGVTGHIQRALAGLTSKLELNRGPANLMRATVGCASGPNRRESEIAQKSAKPADRVARSCFATPTLELAWASEPSGRKLVCSGFLRGHKMTCYRFSGWQPDVAKTTRPRNEIPKDAKPHWAARYLRVQHHGDEAAPLARLVEL